MVTRDMRKFICVKSRRILFFSAPQLSSAFLKGTGKEITTQTIQNLFKEACYNERVGRKMPYVNRKNRKERLYSATELILL